MSGRAAVTSAEQGSCSAAVVVAAADSAVAAGSHNSGNSEIVRTPLAYPVGKDCREAAERGVRG